jgi:predicted small metal-binding protein
MTKVVHCECGKDVEAGSDDELVTKVEEHVAESHPDLVGKMSREQILGMAHEH